LADERKSIPGKATGCHPKFDPTATAYGLVQGTYGDRLNWVDFGQIHLRPCDAIWHLGGGVGECLLCAAGLWELGERP